MTVELFAWIVLSVVTLIASELIVRSCHPSSPWPALAGIAFGGCMSMVVITVIGARAL